MFKEILSYKEINKLSITNIDDNSKYYTIPFSFDIETSKINGKSYMYLWQIGIGDTAIYGRKWDECIDTFNKITSFFDTTKIKLLCLVHNFSYEFQFIKNRFSWKTDKDNVPKIFALDKRDVIQAETTNGIEFRCSKTIFGGSLEDLAKTYCTTQKSHDLDYSIARNSKTQLSNKELQYAINDIAILQEYHQYLMERFGKKIPFTKTGIVRQDFKEAYKQLSKEDKREYKKLIRTSFPTEKEYENWFTYLYCGGMVHADYTLISDEEFDMTIEEDDMRSFDFKSSYISVMFEKFPYKLRPSAPTIDNVIDILNDYKNKCFIGTFIFTNLRRKTNHTTISKHKTIIVEDSIVNTDNGRIADVKGNICLLLNEYDFISLNEFYVYDKVEIIDLKTGIKDYLPDWIIEKILYYWYKKNSATKGTKEYNSVKIDLNSIYGMFVTSFVKEGLSFKNGKLELSGKENKYFTHIKNSIFLPQWGIWVSSMAKFNLLGLCYDITQNSTGKSSDAMYMDTDSIKLRNYLKHKHIIDKYNEEILKRNERLEKEKGWKLGKLGIFDDEGRIYKFKTLGCKKYIADMEENGEVKTIVTISGLKKETLPKYVSIMNEKNNENKTVYDYFVPNMKLEKEYSDKTCSSYTDEKYSDTIVDEFGNIEVMEELSGVSINDTEFKMDNKAAMIETLIQRNDVKFFRKRGV